MSSLQTQIDALEKRIAFLEERLGMQKRSKRAAGFPASITSVQEIVTGTLPQVVWFYAPWCGHCKPLVPIWESLRDSHPMYGWHAVDCTGEGKGMANNFKVNKFPTILIFKGSVVNEYKGIRSSEHLLRHLSSIAR